LLFLQLAANQREPCPLAQCLPSVT